MNIDLRLPSEYVEILQQHVAATGGDIDTLVSGIVADSLQAEVESARSKQISPGSFAEWLQQWANRHPRLEHEIDISRESIYAGCGE
jgi:hypothetical protein